MENSFLQLLISCLTVSIYTVVKQSFVTYIPTQSILPLVILGVINTTIGCWRYFSSINQINVTTVSILGYLEPLSAVIFSVLILKESMTMLQIAGVISIIMGTLISEIRVNSIIKPINQCRNKKIPK